MKNRISHEDLINWLDYSPETGEFVWKKTPPYAKEKTGEVAGHIHSLGYRFIFVGGKKYGAHVLAWFYVHKEWPIEIDHINGVRSDNRIANLRNVTTKVNQQNAKKRSDNQSGITGVSWLKKNKAWQAQIRAEGKIYYLGSTKDFFLACCMRKSAENKYGFHPNHGRTN